VEKNSGMVVLKWLLSISAMVLVVGIVGLLYAKHWLEEFSNTPQPVITQQLFSVKDGDNSRKVLKRLTKQGLVENRLAYRLMLWQQPELAQLKVGRYRLSDNMTPSALFSVLSSGVEAQFSITLIEGLSFSQWLDILRKNSHLSEGSLTDLHNFQQPNISADAAYPYAALEGMFYPDTYHFSDQTNVNAILTRAKHKLDAVLARHWHNRQANLPLKTPYQALVLASIIEKETALASERKTIAGVFVNRLRKGMRLQTDPTVIYGAGADYNGDITRAHLRDKNPYNTYTMKGLPPTPISMVSEESIIAALNPKASSYLYFVASGTGGHYFSKTLAEHNKALRRYLSRNK